MYLSNVIKFLQMTAILLYLRDTNKYIQLNLNIIHHATVLMKQAKGFIFLL